MQERGLKLVADTCLTLETVAEVSRRQALKPQRSSDVGFKASFPYQCRRGRVDWRLTAMMSSRTSVCPEEVLWFESPRAFAVACFALLTD